MKWMYLIAFLYASVVMYLAFEITYPIARMEVRGEAPRYDGSLIKGVTLCYWNDEDLTYAIKYHKNISSKLKEFGYNTIIIPVFLYQDNVSSSHLDFDPKYGPNYLAKLELLGYQFREDGMSVGYYVLVNVGSGEWRGEIEPRDPDSWFNDYSEIISKIRIVSQIVGANVIIVGSEYSSLYKYDQKFSKIINDLKRDFNGHVVFGIIWYEIPLSVIGDFYSNSLRSSDFIGVSAYFSMPLSLGSEDHLASLWSKTYWDYMELLSAKYEKPIFFVEVGCRSYYYAKLMPGYWKNRENFYPGVQDSYFKALLGNKRPFLAGFSVWCEGPRLSDSEDGYSLMKSNVSKLLHNLG